MYFLTSIKNSMEIIKYREFRNCDAFEKISEISLALIRGNKYDR